MKISIRSKIVLAFTFLIGLVIVGQLIFNTFFANDYYLNYKSETMATAYEEIKANYDGTLESIEDISRRYEAHHNINVVALKDDEIFYMSFSKVLEPRGNMPQNEYRLRNDEDATEWDFSNSPKPQVSKQTPHIGSVLNISGEFEFEDENIKLVMTLPVESIEDSVKVFSDSSMIISVLVLFISLIFCLIISKSITKPIKEIEGAASRFANLDFSKKVDENIDSTELHSLAININSMSKQLKQNIDELNTANEKLKLDIDYQKQMEEMRREFVGNVSHEMKTPLSLLQIYAENLKSNVEGIDKEYYCDTIIEESEKLSEMVSSMLQISSIESGLSKMNMQKINISDLVKELVEKITPLADSCDMHAEIEEDIFANADIKYMEQAMKNYITNAFEHTPEGGKVKITLESDGGEVLYSVFNQGNRIAEKEINHIWESFYRVDKSRQRSTNNVGLGLNIVKTVVEKHGGSYHCKNTPDGVVFSFKIAKELN